MTYIPHIMKSKMIIALRIMIENFENFITAALPSTVLVITPAA
jgi:hypothetical protein